VTDLQEGETKLCICVYLDDLFNLSLKSQEF